MCVRGRLGRVDPVEAMVKSVGEIVMEYETGDGDGGVRAERVIAVRLARGSGIRG
jgi:hypothetical protein